MPAEFLLAAACCIWPPSKRRVHAILAAAESPIDWERFLRVARRQRVQGLAHYALASTGVKLPSSVAQELAKAGERIAWGNLLQAAESVRLQRLFDQAGIPVVFVKGVSLAVLAYSSLAFKHSNDIDLLVHRENTLAALILLEREHYSLKKPLDNVQRRIFIAYGHELSLRHRKKMLQVDLHWALTPNPLHLKDVHLSSPGQMVTLFGEGRIHTLDDETLFAYLCVHGAVHAWSRLKWLADLAAFLSGKSADSIAQMYQMADTRGAGICAAQALLLCHRLLGLELPESVLADLRRPNLERLAIIALDAMVGPDAETELDRRQSYSISLAAFLLGRGWRYWFAQLRILSISCEDAIRYPLPRWLRFVYPIIRLPLWLFRAARRRLSRTPSSTSAPR